MKVDVSILSETKLDDSIPDNMIKMEGYHDPVVKKWRNGGGNLVFIADHLVFGQKKCCQNF